MTDMNYDCSLLHLETDNRGFVLDQSELNVGILSDEEGQWTDVKGDFISIKLTRSVGVEKGILFRPESSGLSLVTKDSAYASGVFGKSVRLRYDNDILFVGSVKDSSVSVSPGDDGPVYNLTLNAVDATDDLNAFVHYDFTAPAETTADRADRAWAGVVTNELGRNMAARSDSENPTAMELLQDVADAQIARFYVNSLNQVVIDGSPADDPTLFFSDDHSVTGHMCYKSVSLAENVENSVTSVVVTAKQDDTKQATRSLTSAVVTNQQRYEVDLPYADWTDLQQWADAFPLYGFTALEPNRLTAGWDPQIVGIELLSLIKVFLAGDEYQAGVRSITHTITPENWDVDFDLLPSHTLKYQVTVPPSVPRDFTATSTTDAVSLSWTAPVYTGEMTGYEIRVMTGSVPPEKGTGTLVTTVGTGITSHVITGLDSATTLSYAIFAVTDVPTVYSDKATITVMTKSVVPTVPNDFSASRASATSIALTWTAPSAPGDMDGYVVRFSTGASYPSLPTDGTLAYTGTGTHLTHSGLARNTTYKYSLWAKTPDGQYSPVVQASAVTTETVPSVTRSFVASASSSSSIHLTWVNPSTPGDMNGYTIRYNHSGTAPSSPTSGTLLGNFAATTTATTHSGLADDSTYAYSIWAKTPGGLYGPIASDSATTPLGIISKSWSGYAAWTQTYSGDNSKRTDSDGSANCYYGYFSSTQGNQRSQLGWNVPSEINGCYAVDSVQLIFYNLHTFDNSGATAYLGTHKNASEPSTFTNATTGQATYEVEKPGTFNHDITSWAADNFKSGAKGITLGPAPNTSNSYYGYAAGANYSGQKPWLKITYRIIGG